MATDSPARRNGAPGTRPLGPHARPSRAAQAALAGHFPMALRGYDRRAVDEYVEDVNALIAELEVNSSPAAAVRHALEQVGEETRDILQQAHETADGITARSRSQADDRLQRAEREAQEARQAADAYAAEVRAAADAYATETRAAADQDAGRTRTTAAREAAEMRRAAAAEVAELQRRVEAVEHERRGLLDNLAGIAGRLAEIAEAEAPRVTTPPASDAEDPAPTEVFAALSDDGSS